MLQEGGQEQDDSLEGTSVPSKLSTSQGFILFYFLKLCLEEYG